METMNSWFGLKDAHRDFTIETDEDSHLFFARHELDETLQSMLRRSFRTGKPPKLVLYGDWGVGKTHTMRHIEYGIETTNDFQAKVVFVELPDITSKSTFQVAHAALLDALGFECAKNWIVQFVTKHPSDARNLIQEATRSGDIATAFLHLVGLGEGSRIAADWLRGVRLSAPDSRLAGLPPALTQSSQFVRVLQMFGRLCREVEQRLLVFMLDEATMLDAVSNQDAVNHWQNALKLIADPQTKEFGFIISGSWIDPDDMAIPLQNQQVVSRFGEEHYILLTNLGEGEAKEFITALITEWIDPTKRERLMQAHGAEVDDESISDETFPFTEKALDITVQYACRRGGYTVPRDIQNTLDDLFNRAIDDDRHILSSSYIGSLVNA